MKIRKDIDYIKLLKDSVNYTLANKWLWVFGLIMAVFAGGGGGGTISNFSTSSGVSSGDTDMIDYVFEYGTKAYDSIIESPYIIGIILLLFLLGSVFIGVSWYLRSVARISLIKAAVYEPIGQLRNGGVGSLWVQSRQHLGGLLVLDLLWGLVNFVIMLPVVLIFFLVVFPLLWTIMLCFMTPLILLCIIAIAAGSAIRDVSTRLLVLNSLAPIESIKSAWKLLKNNIASFVIAWLVGLIPRMIYGVINSVVGLVGMLPMLVVFMMGLLMYPFMLVAFLGVSVLCCGFLISSLVAAPYMVFVETYWTKFLSLISNDSKE